MNKEKKKGIVEDVNSKADFKGVAKIVDDFTQSDELAEAIQRPIPHWTLGGYDQAEQERVEGIQKIAKAKYESRSWRDKME